MEYAYQDIEQTANSSRFSEYSTESLQMIAYALDVDDDTSRLAEEELDRRWDDEKQEYTIY